MNIILIVAVLLVITMVHWSFVKWIDSSVWIITSVYIALGLIIFGIGIYLIRTKLSDLSWIVLIIGLQLCISAGVNLSVHKYMSSKWWISLVINAVCILIESVILFYAQEKECPKEVVQPSKADVPIETPTTSPDEQPVDEKQSGEIELKGIGKVTLDDIRRVASGLKIDKNEI